MTTIVRPDRLLFLLSERTPWCMLYELTYVISNHADGRSDGREPLVRFCWFVTISVSLELSMFGIKPDEGIPQKTPAYRGDDDQGPLPCPTDGNRYKGSSSRLKTVCRVAPASGLIPELYGLNLPSL